MLVCRDFNFDPNNSVTAHQKTLNNIRDIMEDQKVDRGWQQLVTDLTRFQRGDEPALLDHIYTNQEDFVEQQRRVQHHAARLQKGEERHLGPLGA